MGQGRIAESPRFTTPPQASEVDVRHHRLLAFWRASMILVQPTGRRGSLLRVRSKPNSSMMIIPSGHSADRSQQGPDRPAGAQGPATVPPLVN